MKIQKKIVPLRERMNKTEKIKDVEKVLNYWTISSDEDYEVMNSLYQSKKYAWSLFLGHIVIEKLLKAYYVKKHQEHAPFTHNLYRLAELSEIELNEEYAEWLFKITTFNLNARYDDYKREFQRMCTDSFTKEWIEKINALRTWIKQTL